MINNSVQILQNKYTVETEYSTTFRKNFFSGKDKAGEKLCFLVISASFYWLGQTWLYYFNGTQDATPHCLQSIQERLVLILTIFIR